MGRSEPHHPARSFDGTVPESHFAMSLIVGTVVAAPVLLAALTGRQDVPPAVVMYLVAILGSWFLIGLVGGVVAMVGRASEAEGSPAGEPPATAHPTDPPLAGTVDADASTASR